MEEKKKYIIKEETVNKVLNYLANKPFAEVSGLINEIRTTLQLVKEEQENTEETKNGN